jgi:hypothetical protein
MNKTLATILVAGAAISMNAFAQADSSVSTTSVDPSTGAKTTITTTTTERLVTPPATVPLTKGEQKDLKNQSEADYKARKKIADANLDENKAACENAAYGSLERACKKDAKVEAKKDKADAKVIHESEKVDIKNNGQ